MAGRGRGIGRGRGKPKVEPVPNLSGKDREILLRDGLPKPEEGQFEDTRSEKSEDTSTTESNTTNTPKRDTDVDGIKDRQSEKQKDDAAEKTMPITLNPNSKDFQPKLVNGLPGTSASRSQSSPAKLNPHSTEFVPRSSRKLNVMAAEFVPTSYVPPQAASSNPDPPPSDESLTVLDILEGFDRKSSDDDPVLVEAATMLIEATMYPGTYDDHLRELSETIKSNPPSDEVLQDVGQMLIKWGICKIGLRYTAVRMCDFMCKLDLQSRFRSHFFSLLQKMFKAEQNKDSRSEEEETDLIEFSLFVAEMFYRVRIGDDQVVWVLGLAVFELMFIMLNIRHDETVKCACNILKLTGYLLEHKTPSKPQFKPHDKMETLVMSLKHLCNDPSLSKRTCEVIISVIQFRGTRYGRVTAEKNVDHKQVEVPVQREEDWSEFLDERGNVIEGCYDPDFEEYDLEDQTDPNIDEEMMKAYEDFLQDFEEHLLLQEFGEHPTNEGGMAP